MRQVNIHGVDDVRLDTIGPVSPGPTDAVVRIAACGICGTDLAFIRRGGTVRRAEGPMPLGHEAAGVVVAVGSEVTGITLGQRVVVNPMGADLTNVIGTGGTEGAFTEELLVRRAAIGTTLFPIPDDLPLDVAALTEPLAVALHSINRADPKPDEKVVVFGAGPIGLGAVIWLRERGVTDIVVVDLHEERLARAMDLGARAVIRADTEDFYEALMAVHGKEYLRDRAVSGTHVYLDYAGAASIVGDVIRLARWHARLIITAVYSAPIMVDMGRMMLRSEMSITTSIGYPDELPDVIAALPALQDKLKRFVSHTMPFDQVIEGFEVARGNGAGKVLITMS